MPIYRIKRKSILGFRIYVVIGGFSLLAAALLRGSSVHLSSVLKALSAPYDDIFGHISFRGGLLDASSNLYWRICLSVGQCLSFCCDFVKNNGKQQIKAKGIPSISFVTQNTIILFNHEDTLLALFALIILRSNALYMISEPFDI